MAKSKEIQVKEKKELSGPSEQTTPGPVFTPDVDIFESEKDITLLADIPGVTAETLNIDLRENTLTIIGEVPSTKSDEAYELITEYDTGKYYRQFSLSETCSGCSKTGYWDSFFCPACLGYGRVRSERTFSLSIPPHTIHGSQARICLEDVGLKDTFLNILVTVKPDLDHEAW